MICTRIWRICPPHCWHFWARSANFGATLDEEQYHHHQQQTHAGAQGGSAGETHSALIQSLFSNTPPVLRFVPEGERGALVLFSE